MQPTQTNESTNAQHTPGEWLISRPGYMHGAIVVHGTQDGTTANDVAYCNGPHKEANARLIAQAPELAARVDALLEACKRVADRRMWRNLNGELTWAGETPDGNEIETEGPIAILRAAIARAEKGAQ